MGTTQDEQALDTLAAELGRRMEQRGGTIAVAESLTGGLVVQALARVEGSGAWLAGGVVAYATSVKRALLHVTAGKVVSREAAEQMAAGARRCLRADVAVSVTGVAGPDGQDGMPPGTVWIGTDDGVTACATLFTMRGTPSEICQLTTFEALRQLAGALAA